MKTVDHVVRVTAALMQVSAQLMRSPAREISITTARHLAMWAGVRVLGHTLSEVARNMKRDHTTVISAVRKVDQRVRCGDFEWIDLTSRIFDLLQSDDVIGVAARIEKENTVQKSIVIAAAALRSAEANREERVKGFRAWKQERDAAEDAGGWSRRELAEQNRRFGIGLLRGMMQESLERGQNCSTEFVRRASIVCEDQRADERHDQRRASASLHMGRAGPKPSRPKRLLTDRQKRRIRLMVRLGFSNNKIIQRVRCGKGVLRDYRRTLPLPTNVPLTQSQRLKAKVLELHATEHLGYREICRRLPDESPGAIAGVLWRNGLCAKRNPARGAQGVEGEQAHV